MELDPDVDRICVGRFKDPDRHIDCVFDVSRVRLAGNRAVENRGDDEVGSGWNGRTTLLRLRPLVKNYRSRIIKFIYGYPCLHFENFVPKLNIQECCLASQAELLRTSL